MTNNDILDENCMGVQADVVLHRLSMLRYPVRLKHFFNCFTVMDEGHLFSR